MGTRTVSQVINLKKPDDSIEKYITRINEGGIMVHPENNTNNSINIGNFVDIQQNGTIVASYGKEVIVGNTSDFYISMGNIYIVVDNPTGNPSESGYIEKNIISNPEGNPITQGWYESFDGEKILRPSKDTAVGTNTRYYTIIDSIDTTVVTGKKYYQIQPRLSFFQNKNNEVAYITNNQLYITQSVVLQQMDLGTMVAQGGLGQWSWKIHPNGDIPSRNNLNLKWVG